jgi:hypothetical protein
VSKQHRAATTDVSQRRWHIDEAFVNIFVKINGELHNPWRAVDREGEWRAIGAQPNLSVRVGSGKPRPLRIKPTALHLAIGWLCSRLLRE